MFSFFSRRGDYRRSPIFIHVLIITGIFPPDIGGPATYVPQISHGLAERGYRVTVLTLSDRLHHNDSHYDFSVLRLPRRQFKPLLMLQTIWAIIRLGRKAHVLFVNGLALEATLANLFLRKPMVLKVVGDLAWERCVAYRWVQDSFEDFQRKRYGLRVGLLKRLRTWWTRRADKVIVPSRYLARWVACWGIPNEKLVVIYNALEPVDHLRPAELPLKTKFNAVTVGRLVPWKRIDQIVKTLAPISHMGLVIVGEGPEQPRLQQISKDLKNSDRVYFAGRCSKDKTLALMAACDLFVLNSTYEGLPHVVLEAMSLGLPVVATAVGGTPEVVLDGENGVLIPTREGDALSAAIMRLHSDVMLRGRLAEGAREVVEVFKFSRLLKETVNVLIGVLRKAHP